MREWTDIAHLAKTRNLDGGFVAKSAAGLPFLLEPGMEVALVPPVLDRPRRVHVDRVTDADGARATVHFSEVADAETAHDLVGCHCLVRTADLDSALFETVPETWVSWLVVDEKAGVVGHAVDVIDNGAQQLLEVARDKGPKGADTVLIPLVDAIVKNVDVRAERIDVALPAGLLDL